MTVWEQIDGLPLFMVVCPHPRERLCASCDHPFTPQRPNLVHQRYCCLKCQQRARNVRRRDANASPPPDIRQPALPPVCQCGADLVRVESDWMTGQTFEVCARGHRTNPVLRRRLAA